MNPPHPTSSDYFIQSEISLFSLLPREENAILSCVFFSDLLLLKVQSHVVAGRWPGFRLPAAPSETESSEDDKRKGFSAITFWPVNKCVLQLLMDGRRNSCLSWKMGGVKLSAWGVCWATERKVSQEIWALGSPPPSRSFLPPQAWSTCPSAAILPFRNQSVLLF